MKWCINHCLAIRNGPFGRPWPSIPLFHKPLKSAHLLPTPHYATWRNKATCYVQGYEQKGGRSDQRQNPPCILYIITTNTCWVSHPPAVNGPSSSLLLHGPPLPLGSQLGMSRGTERARHTTIRLPFLFTRWPVTGIITPWPEKTLHKLCLPASHTKHPHARTCSYRD